MERKHFISLIGLGVTGIAFCEITKNEIPKSSRVQVLFIGQYIPEEFYCYAIESGFNCAQLMTKMKGSSERKPGISERKDMEDLILGNEISDFRLFMEDVNFYDLAPLKAEIASRESHAELCKLLQRSFSDLVLVAHFGCNMALGILKIISVCLPKTGIKIHLVANNSPLGHEKENIYQPVAWEDDEKQYQQFILKKTDFETCLLSKVTTLPQHSNCMDYDKGNRLEYKLFFNNFIACLHNL